MWIIGEAGSVTLHVRELEVITYSLSTLVEAVRDRVRTLQGMYGHPKVASYERLIADMFLHHQSNVQAAEPERKGSTQQVLLWTGLFRLCSSISRTVTAHMRSALVSICFRGSRG